MLALATTARGDFVGDSYDVRPWGKRGVAR